MAEGKMKLNPAIFGVRQINPGYVYIVESGNSYKIGKSKNGFNRLKSARTWLPDMKIIGMKPFWSYSAIERSLHAGFSTYWYHGEWFKFDDERDKEILLEGFQEFSDFDRDRNSVDFIYWFNGDGMSEFVSEMARQNKTLRKFLIEESCMQKTNSAASCENQQKV